MGEASRQRLWHSCIRVFVFLNVMWNLVQCAKQSNCGMEKWGLNYMGSQNVTADGKNCQYWATGYPHEIDPEIKDENFPDGSKQEARNFCRNPKPVEKYGIWCYTTDSKTKWDYCDPCPGKYETYNSCKLSDKGANYDGKMAFSRAHFECEPWTKHPSLHFLFKDGSAEQASNYCRNPDTTNFDGPWCFVKEIRGFGWDYCDVCTPFLGEVDKKSGTWLKHSTKLSGMPLPSCIQWCINFLSCLAVDIEVNGKGCYYHTWLTGERTLDVKWDHYVVRRICQARAAGKQGYFTTFPSSGAGKGTLMEGVSEMTACESRCIENPKCVMFDIATDKKCYSHENINDKWYKKDSVNQRHLARCDPNLTMQDAGKQKITWTDVPMITFPAAPGGQTEAAFAQESRIPDETPPVTERSILALVTPLDDTVGTANAPPNVSQAPAGMSTPTIVGMVIGVAVGLGCCFACYKLCRKKKSKKDGNRKGERQKITARKHGGRMGQR